VLYGLLAALVVLYPRELRWAAVALPWHLAGGFPPQEEQLLASEAVDLIRSGQDLARARDLLAGSLAIDPNSRSRFFLGEALFLREGDLEAALVEYRRYLKVDRSDLPTVLRIAEILERQGRNAERRSLLERSLSRFRAEGERHRPRPDPGVAPRFNRKAEELHRRYVEGAETLSAQLARAPAGAPDAARSEP
jgi:tetratricopeptide (TPR) repeat protein